ncbi:MAG: SIS domain-containing protein, partial [Bacteroidetes bacterium]|nr:SIS domain-containing protein [Bacteroidota bacterium]
MNYQQVSQNYINELITVLNCCDHDQFKNIVGSIMGAYERDSRIFIMGNGGSGSAASHAACDINKGCCFDLDKKFKMISLCDNIPTMLAIANDVSYEAIFVEQLKNFFVPGDLVIGISGSGNSENVLRAISYARDNGGITIGLSGFSGGKLSKIVDIPFIVKIDDMQKVEDVHVIIIHMI